MEYEMMVPPFERVEFEEMTKKQAQEYFDWYMDQKENRISMLLSFAKDEGVVANFDYSVESLIPLWEWYEKKIYCRELDFKEYQEQLMKYPEWMKDFVSKKELSWETLMYCMDVALYFAEVIIRHNSSIRWGFFTKPKNRDGVNQPVLLGFLHNMDMNPRQIVVNCTRDSAENKSATRLFDVYNVWMSYV